VKVGTLARAESSNKKAEVLLQFDDVQSWVVLLKIEDVVYICAVK